MDSSYILVSISVFWHQDELPERHNHHDHRSHARERVRESGGALSSDNITIEHQILGVG